MNNFTKKKEILEAAGNKSIDQKINSAIGNLRKLKLTFKHEYVDRPTGAIVDISAFAGKLEVGNVRFNIDNSGTRWESVSMPSGIFQRNETILKIVKDALK